MSLSFFFLISAEPKERVLFFFSSSFLAERMWRKQLRTLKGLYAKTAVVLAETVPTDVKKREKKKGRENTQVLLPP